MFIGEYRHSVDEKGRVAVPARFRGQLTEHVVVARWLDACIAVFPQAEFQRHAERLSALPLGDPTARAMRRQLFGYSYEVEPDRQGRVLIPQQLRDWAGLADEAVVVGGDDHLELWAPDRWASYSAEMSAPEVLAERLQNLGF